MARRRRWLPASCEHTFVPLASALRVSLAQPALGREDGSGISCASLPREGTPAWTSWRAQASSLIPCHESMPRNSRLSCKTPRVFPAGRRARVVSTPSANGKRDVVFSSSGES